ncbi:MAG: hypothetical protein V4659_04030 [Pseudomonadota bacterium]
MNIQITHAAPQLRHLDRVEDVTFRALSIRFSADELRDLTCGLHVVTDIATIKEVRHVA